MVLVTFIAATRSSTVVVTMFFPPPSQGWVVAVSWRRTVTCRAVGRRSQGGTAPDGSGFFEVTVDVGAGAEYWV